MSLLSQKKSKGRSVREASSIALGVIMCFLIKIYI